jgi:hypothetical protein
MTYEDICVAVYPRHILAEEAVAELKRAGIDTTKASVVGRGYNPFEKEEKTGCPGGQSWERTGAFWGGIREVGSMTFYRPGTGFVVVAGPLARWVLGAIEIGFAHDGLGPLGVALQTIGLPLDATRRYEREVSENRCLLVLPCATRNAPEAEQTVRKTQPWSVEVHPREPEPAPL